MIMPAPQHFRLKNGLNVTVIHDAQATQASALIELAAGSLQEPAEWPGLAHLLEHVLFTGSRGFQNEQRLMAWAPAQGARLNATTMANQTAWFFEVAPPKLADGLSRLVDMLTRPLLAEEAVAQEVAVIEAEYQMLTTHSPTLCAAALGQAFVTPHPFADFHVGNMAHFGENIPRLRRALYAFHQREFHAQNFRLWLYGPQSSQELAGLAEKSAACFPQATAASPNVIPARLILRPERAFALQSSGTRQLWLSFPAAGISPELLSLLQELLTDKATGSLHATLSAQGLCDDITLLEPYRSADQSLLSVVFQPVETSPDRGAMIEALFCRWLQLLPALTSPQLTHYASLARRRFARQTPLDQLRSRAFGFAPTGNLTREWEKLLACLQVDNMTRLWVTPDVSLPVNLVQGFPLKSGPIAWPATPSGPWPEMFCHQPGAALPPPPLPAVSAPLRAAPATGDATLLLTPFPGERLEERSAAIIKAALRPLVADIYHHGGELNFSQQQGIWLLQISGSRALLHYGVDKIVNTLGAPSPAAIAQGERLCRQAQQSLFDNIAVRCLLNRLPSLLLPAAVDLPEASFSSDKQPGNETTSHSAVPGSTTWQAVLYGGDQPLQQTVARLLSRFPAALRSKAPGYSLAWPTRQEYTFATQSRDAAVIVFYPLPAVELLTLATWQVMAALFEPHFFRQMRQEKNIGYVVSCRFHCTAGRAGLLFALQSPTLPKAELYRCIITFIAGMKEQVHAVTTEALQEKILALQNACPVKPPNNPAQCVEHWLFQQLNLPPLTRETYRQLRPEHLRQAQRYLCEEPHRCWHLSNTSLPVGHHPD